MGKTAGFPVPKSRNFLKRSFWLVSTAANVRIGGLSLRWVDFLMRVNRKQPIETGILKLSLRTARSMIEIAL